MEQIMGRLARVDKGPERGGSALQRGWSPAPSRTQPALANHTQRPASPPRRTGRALPGCLQAETGVTGPPATQPPAWVPLPSRSSAPRTPSPGGRGDGPAQTCLPPAPAAPAWPRGLHPSAVPSGWISFPNLHNFLLSREEAASLDSSEILCGGWTLPGGREEAQLPVPWEAAPQRKGPWATTSFPTALSSGA